MSAARRPGFCENGIDPQPRNPREMPEVTRYQLEVMAEGCSGDLQVGIGHDPARRLQMCPDLAIHTRRGHVVGKRAHGR